MKTSSFIVGIVLALVVGVFIGYFIERQRAVLTLDTTKMMMQQKIDQAATKTDKDTAAKQNTTMMAKTNPVMMASNTKAGSYLTGTNGMALYTYDKDTTGQSNCSGVCAKNWPAYTVSGTAPSPMPMHLGTIQRSDGTMQYTWNGKPLYYYMSDKDKTDTYGDGVGGVWHLAK